MTTEVEVKILNDDIQTYGLPAYETDGSAAMDLRACIQDPITLLNGDTVLIPTGIAINIEDQNVAATILPRSGLGHKHGIVLGNLVGLIDSDYQGELFISCWNRGNMAFTVNPGDRIAQLMFVPVVKSHFKVVKEFQESERGKGGFGSTGTK